MPQGVVDVLEAVEIDEEHSGNRADLPPRPGERVLEAIQEERAVGQIGERIVQDLVLHGGRHLRVSQREAGMFGESDQRVLLRGREDAPGLARGHRETTDNPPGLSYGRSHRDLDTVAYEGGDPSLEPRVIRN